ncbi:MAG: hypothetical protein QM656_16230 [Paracoccaceae bacterium]
MQKNRSRIAGITLIAVALGGLSSVAWAEKGPGPRGMGPGFGLERMFAQLDADKDGKITRAEVDAWKAAQPKVEDTNGDGKISADELAAPRIAEATRRANERAAELVKQLDTDGDGLLSAAELAQGPALGPQSEGPGFDRIFDRIDADKDGAITLPEAEAARDRMMDRARDDRGPGDRGPGRGDHRPGKGWGDHGPGKGPRPPAPGDDMPPPPAPEGGN